MLDWSTQIEIDAPLIVTLTAFAVASLLVAVLISHIRGRKRTRETAALASSLRQANEELHQLAYKDPLTGLANRACFDSWLDEAVLGSDRDSSAVAVLFVDLDAFKPLNDSFGHGFGDTVLREVGQRLQALAAGHVKAARVGGDEFLLLLRHEHGGRDAAAALAQDALRSLTQPITAGTHEVQVSCSIGIVLYPDHGSRPMMLARADAAMFAAKRSGGGTYTFYDPSMEADVRDQLELLSELRRAVSAKRLELMYQPKIDARSGQITAAEALLRWHHPQRGLISPAVFVPIAERFGLIHELGSWVIEDACRQARAWRDLGLRMRVAINLSAHQMRRDDLASLLLSALKRHGVDPSQLTCEITESVAMEDTRATHQAFERLGKAGIHLSIDDFGTGYSSLSYLRRLPAEELKIDRSFVKDVESSADARAIVEAVVRMAQALGLKVVAEGVETEGQRDMLVKLGCDQLQGYLFARPMSARALTIWAMDSGPSSPTAAFRASLFEAVSAVRKA
jgi:diguanylate cyclase (GGDEF)-like protein